MQQFDNLFEHNNPEYLKHPVFEEIKYLSEFYDLFSYSVPDTPVTGARLFINPDALVYSSIEGTLESILHVLKSGRIGDAYALLRKYYDSVIINIYTNLYIEENSSLENLVVTKITDWFNGKEKLPEYRVMSRYIRASEKLQEMSNLLNSDEYKQTRERCNDNVHYNFFKNMTMNNNSLNHPERIKWLDMFSKDIRDIFILHFGYLYFLKGLYMASTDYIDFLEAGMTPEKDSQYIVAPFIQEAFDNIIKKYRPDVADLIKSSTYMKLA